MNNVRTRLVVFLVGVSALFAATPSAMAAEPMSLKDAGAVFNQWIAAYQLRDAAKLMSVYDKSLIYSAEGEADQNYNELKASYLTYFATNTTPTRWKAIPKEIHAQAGLAVVISIWEQREKAAAANSEPIARVRSVDVFKRLPAGWKIVRTITYPEAN